LAELLRFSENLDPDADRPDPDLAPVEFDEEAMAEAWGELDPEEEDQIT
jgi:hypothetical protein